MRNLACFLVVFDALVGFCPGASQAQNAIPNLILRNGTIITMNPLQPQAQAVAIAGDHILAVGTNQEILARKGAGTQIVDLGGRTVMPGFVDSHTHIFNDAEAHMGLTLEQAQQLALRNGITTLADMFVTEDFLRQMRTFEQQGKLKIRTSLYLVYTDNCGNVIGDWYKNYPPTRNFGEMLRIGGVKIFTDGGTCGLPGVSFEYNNGGGHGDLFLTQDQLNRMVAAIDSNGYQVAMHALGDSAVSLAQNAIAATLKGRPNTLRHRIEHNSWPRPDQLSRYSDIGIIPTVFGYIGTCEEDSLAIYEAYLGSQHLSWVRPLRAMLDANPGLPIAWHGDDPWVGPNNPILDLFAFVTRKEVAADRISTCDPPDWMKRTAITVQEALRMMTINAAYALFREDEVGSLEPGKLADLIVLSEDPLTIPSDSLKNLDVLATLVGGNVEYCNPAQPFLCSALQNDVAREKPVTASKSLADNPPELAVDGDPETSWGSGDFPPQWIEIDLREMFPIAEIRLLTDQFPDGETTHKVWGKSADPGAAYRLLHKFQEFTTYGQTLSYAPPQPWTNVRFIKVETVQSPSWVSWKEINVVAANVTDVVAPSGETGPATIELIQNYPNPFNPGTTIEYKVRGTGQIRIRIFNVIGEPVRNLVNEVKTQGLYRVLWDGKDDGGRPLPSGAYYYQLTSDSYAAARRMILLK